jgi:hypothetical protein
MIPKTGRAIHQASQPQGAKNWFHQEFPSLFNCSSIICLEVFFLFLDDDVFFFFVSFLLLSTFAFPFSLIIFSSFFSYFSFFTSCFATFFFFSGITFGSSSFVWVSIYFQIVP